jgi:methionine-rich copper-binding protein CopC
MTARRFGWAASIAAVLVTALAGALAGASSGAVPPAAHARLNGSVPVADSLVPQAPAAVVLSFNRDIAPPATVVVTAPDGSRAGAGDPSVRGRDVSAPIGGEQEGTYVVAFRAVSVDGHPITGRFTFSVGHRSTPPTPARPPGDGRPWWPWAAGLGGLVVVGAGLLRWRRGRARSLDE